MKNISFTETHVSIMSALLDREISDTKLKLVQSGVIKEVAEAATAVLHEMKRRIETGDGHKPETVPASIITTPTIAPLATVAPLPAINKKLRKKMVVRPKPIYGQIAALIADGDNEKDIADVCEVPIMVVRTVKGHFKKEIGALKSLPARDRKNYIAQWFKDDTAPTNGHLVTK